MKPLLKKDYRPLAKKSSGKIVMPRVSASRLYERFVCGVPTVYELHTFEWVQGWSFGHFHDANRFELIEEYDSKRTNRGDNESKN